MDQHLIARKQMITNQITPGAYIPSPILEAILSVARHEFVLPQYRDSAYIDTAVPYAPGRTLLPPLVMAKLLASLELTSTSNILDVGCGNGYSSALLTKIGKYVTAIDSESKLIDQANHLCKEIQIENVNFKQHNIKEGYEPNQPYHAIFIGGLVPSVPDTLFDQLAVSGKLVAIIDTGSILASATLFEKTKDRIHSKELFEVPVSHITPLL